MNKTILAKGGSKIIKDRQEKIYINKCQSAGICPKCGERLDYISVNLVPKGIKALFYNGPLEKNGFKCSSCKYSDINEFWGVGGYC